MMDKTLLLVLAAACICGSFKDKSDLPLQFKGNLATAKDGHEYSNNNALPYYAQAYGHINQGE